MGLLTLDSCHAIYLPLILEAPSTGMGCLVATYILLYIQVVSICLMNLVTAVTVEGALHQARDDEEYEKYLLEKNREHLKPVLLGLFNELDADGSGDVTLEELRFATELLKTEVSAFIGGFSWSPEDVIAVMDTDEDDRLSLDEF